MADKRQSIGNINNIQNIEDIKKILNYLIEKVDIIYGNRGESPFITKSSLPSINLQSILNELNSFVKLDGSRKITGVLSYNELKQFNDFSLVNKWYVDKQDASKVDKTNLDIEILTQTISDPPTKEEVENIQNKVNEIITKLSEILA